MVPESAPFVIETPVGVVNVTVFAVTDRSVTILPFSPELVVTPVNSMMSPIDIEFETLTVVFPPVAEMLLIDPYCPGVPCSTI